MTRKRIVIQFVMSIAILAISSCGTTVSHSPSPSVVSPISSPSLVSPSPSPQASCDASLWDHVYHPQRLSVINTCETVTGTIEIIRHEADGDLHILVKLDPQYANLVNSVNISDQHGDLVVEPVCVDQVTQVDAQAACSGYHSPIQIPAIGSHVTVTGSYVLDTVHGWDEEHPVSSIQVTS